MSNSNRLKQKGVDLSQRPPKRKRDVVRIPVVIETPLVPTENAPSSSRWHSNVVLLLNFMMSFLCTIFSWAFTSEDIVRVPAAIETPLVPAENAPSSSGWHSNVCGSS
jgi:6,7-dimethyl-8-ribityllumazine synthase